MFNEPLNRPLYVPRDYFDSNFDKIDKNRDGKINDEEATGYITDHGYKVADSPNLPNISFDEIGFKAADFLVVGIAVAKEMGGGCQVNAGTDWGVGHTGENSRHYFGDAIDFQSYGRTWAVNFREKFKAKLKEMGYEKITYNPSEAKPGVVLILIEQGHVHVGGH